MATVTKDFRVKNGLVVEGSNATVNGSNVLTENSTEFIQDTAASLFTNGTHSGITFDYDDSGNVINATVSSTPTFSTEIIFEGATVDSYETVLQVVDPTQDNTITLPNTTGTVVLDSATQTLTNKTLTSPTISGSPVITGLSSVGMVTTSATPKSYVDSILGSATAAATSAASAATSASSAATSASSAATSASSAATSATASATSASAAATSATSASSSATAASTSASSASTSASSASTSASSAATSATSSATSASAAATSATSAAASATSAATSASSAAASATAAATSATSAALSYTTFNDQYLGAKSSAPTLNNSGGALVSGNLYFNTSDSTLYVYNVSTWQAAAVSTAGFATTGSNTFTGNQLISVNSSGNALEVRQIGSGNAFVVEDSANPDATPFVINTDGRVLVGHTTAGTVVVNAGLQVSGTGGTSYISQTRFSADANGPGLLLSKSRGTSYSSRGAVSSSDTLGQISFTGDDGTNYVQAANIYGYADGTVSTGVIPGRLVFQTADSAGTITERMRIDSSGNVGVGGTPAAGRNFALSSNITGSITSRGYTSIGQIQSDVTSTATYFASSAATQTAIFTLSNLKHYTAIQGSFGVGSTVTNQYGFVAESTLTGATNNYGFYGDIASGTNRWNLYMPGTAANYFAGQTTVGSVSLTLGSGSVAQQFGVVSTSATNIATVIRGAASQTGDLTQWQNSAGTVLSRINSGGSLELNGKDIELMTLMGAF